MLPWQQQQEGRGKVCTRRSVSARLPAARGSSCSSGGGGSEEDTHTRSRPRPQCSRQQPPSPPPVALLTRRSRQRRVLVLPSPPACMDEKQLVPSVRQHLSTSWLRAFFIKFVTNTANKQLRTCSARRTSTARVTARSRAAESAGAWLQLGLGGVWVWLEMRPK